MTEEQNNSGMEPQQNSIPPQEPVTPVVTPTPPMVEPIPQATPYPPEQPTEDHLPPAAQYDTRNGYQQPPVMNDIYGTGIPQYQANSNLDQINTGGTVGQMQPDPNIQPLLQLNGVTKSYGPKLAVNNAFLNVFPGRIVGLLGPNGSGKTTIIKMISGLIKPTYGKIYIGGYEPGIESKSLVSYLPERTYLDEQMKAKDAVAYFTDFYPDFDSNRAVDMLGRLGIDLNSKIKAMSKGTKEKLQLILVMSRRARLYLLDEPIGGVDPAARDYILHTILTNYSPDSTVILSTHLIHDIEPVLDDIIFINQGQIVLTSSVDDIREQHGKSVNDLFREVFRC